MAGRPKYYERPQWAIDRCFQLADRIDELCAARKMSARRLSLESGVDLGFTHRLRLRRGLPHLETLFRVADALQCDVLDLLALPGTPLKSVLDNRPLEGGYNRLRSEIKRMLIGETMTIPEMVLLKRVDLLISNLEGEAKQ